MILQSIGRRRINALKAERFGAPAWLRDAGKAIYGPRLQGRSKRPTGLSRSRG